MSLAIVIPYYNIDFFEKTLFSLSYQTNKRFKVYIGNNNSPNTPINLIRKYGGEFDIVYKEFFNERNPISLSEQFSQCISLISDEDWFMILGDDDFLEKDVISDFYENLPCINDSNINVVKFSTAVINEHDELISKIYKFSSIEYSTDLFIKRLRQQTRSSLSEHIFRTSQFFKYKIPYYPLAWHSDDMMVLKYTEFSAIYCICSSIVFIRMSNKNISGQRILYSEDKKKASIDFFSEILFKYHNKFKFEELELIFGMLLQISLSYNNSENFYKLLNLGKNILGLKEIEKKLLLMKKYNMNNCEVSLLM